MKTLRVAVCDDDPGFRALLRAEAERVLGESGFVVSAAEAASADELSAAPGLMGLDLILLDIDMPGTDGILFGEQLRSLGCRSDIIYVSNLDERVYEIFRVHPWSFVRKSRFAEELPGVLGEYARARRNWADALLLTGEAGQTVPVDPEAMVYAEAVGKLQRLVFADPEQTSLIRASMRELEATLAPLGFIRVHKGFLVNYRYIKKITSRSVLLDTGGDLPVGRDRLAAARERYLSLMKWRGIKY